MLIIDETTRAHIAAHGEAEYPNECVGLLLGRFDDQRREVVRVLPLENRWNGQMMLSEQDNPHSRRDRFYLDPRDYLRADRQAQAEGLEVIGIYHSHPDWPATPSPRDLSGAQGLGSAFSFVIQSVRRGQAAELTSWTLAQERSHFIREVLQQE